ncbi:unnamed protein product [Phytomonas sp. EM1]|nr:unnamed protein product [Phytomonas sp. EM1]|eukprot:CCW59882.1 unnamed protein product [Phytomonas sp. isolate EM1]
MNQAALVKDQLLSQGANHFVILSPIGTVLEHGGDFDNPMKQRLAHAIIQKCAHLLEPGESFKRVSMTMEEVVYTATTVSDGQGGTLGILVKRPASVALATDQ